MKRPVDAFRLFEAARTELNIARKDPYLRFVTANKLIESATVIIDEDYGLVVKNILPDDPSVIPTLDVMTEISEYAKGFAKAITYGRAAIKSVSAEKDREQRILLKKRVTAVIKNDRVIEMIIGKIQIIASRSRSTFAERLFDEIKSDPKNPLLQPIKVAAA